GVVLLTYHHQVTVGYCGVDHRITDHGEHEQTALTDQSTGQGEDFLHRFLGQDRTAGGDSPEQRNGRGVFVTGLVGGEFGRSGAAGATQFHRSRSVLVTVEVALVLKHLELVRDAGGARQPDRVADLPDGGRKAAVLQIPLKEVQDALLTSGEFGCWG